MTTQFEPMAEIQTALARVFQRRNWLLGWPTLIGFAVVIAVAFTLLGHALGPDFMRQLASGSPPPPSNQPLLDIEKLLKTGAVFFLVVLFVFPLFTGWVFAAAAEVWAGKDPNYGAAFRRVLSKWLALIVFQVILAIVAVVSFITIIGPIIIAVLGTYGPAYVIFDDKSPFEAIGATFRLAWRNFGATLLLLLAIIAVSVVFAIPAWVLYPIPSVGWILGLAFRIAGQVLVSGFVALVIVRFYDRLRAAPATSAS